MRLDLSSLNDPQRDAVLHEEGPLVVFAGAGSGKTRVITYRIAHMVLEREIAPWRILAVTFTNKAAAEMRERLGHLVPGRAEGLVVGTFHATCARLLRRFADRAGIKRDFAIYDDSDQRAMMTRIARDMSLDDKRFPARTLAGHSERAKQEMLEPEQVEIGWDTQTVRRVLVEYEKRMRKANALDFGDLIYLMVRTLERDEALRMELAGRFRAVLVDEFQDTNGSQMRLVLALTKNHGQICVVGDDDQSIYRWRGADRRNILDFRQHFAGARVVKLEQNYRSTERILAASHAVIEKNDDREPKQLWTDKKGGSPVRVVRNEDEREEAQLVLRTLAQARREGKRYQDVAVFYRIHAQSRVLEEALRGANVPYKIVGGQRFYDRAEIKDLLSYLRAVMNPEDDIAVLRVINTPTRGIGKTTLERLMNRAAEKGMSVFDAAKEASEERGGGKLAAFVALLDGLRLESEELGLAGLAQQVLERSGYRQSLATQDNAEADARLENLAELIGAIDQFESEAEDPSLAAFLESVTLDPDRSDGEGDDDVLLMMTVHAAKGLEFPVVMVVGLEEDLFPLRSDPLADDEHLAEERRLAYVAMTRARENLIMSWASTRYVFGNLRMGTRSRFLNDLPADAIELEGRQSTASSLGRSLGSALGGGGGSGSGSSYPSRRFAERTPRGRPETPKRSSDEVWVDRSETQQEGLRVGMKLRHFKWGVGRVVSLKGGEPPRVELEFPDRARRTIRVDFLEPV